MKHIADFEIEVVVLAENNNLVFLGKIINGEVSKGDFIEFKIEGNKSKKEIVWVEKDIEVKDGFTNEPNNSFSGIFILCDDETEFKEIRKLNVQTDICKVLQ